MPSVLIVEDDEAMAVALRDGFEYEGFTVHTASDGQTALQKAASASPDLILLDVMLPKMTGLDVCRRIRREGNLVPIIMLTARGQEIDKILGLKTGADDYVTKPFSFMELVARVEAVLRRATRQREPIDAFEFGDVRVGFADHTVTKAGRPVPLSNREFELLRYFVEHRGQVLTRERLLEAVWGYPRPPFTRTVDIHVAKLRKKIEDRPSEPRFILTAHRTGYRFAG